MVLIFDQELYEEFRPKVGSLVAKKLVKIQPRLKNKNLRSRLILTGQLFGSFPEDVQRNIARIVLPDLNKSDYWKITGWKSFPEPFEWPVFAALLLDSIPKNVVFYAKEVLNMLPFGVDKFITGFLSSQNLSKATYYVAAGLVLEKAFYFSRAYVTKKPGLRHTSIISNPMVSAFMIYRHVLKPLSEKGVFAYEFFIEPKLEDPNSKLSLVKRVLTYERDLLKSTFKKDDYSLGKKNFSEMVFGAYKSFSNGVYVGALAVGSQINRLDLGEIVRNASQRFRL